jgi:hypothetical protein
MDTETLIRSFRAERAEHDPEARAAAWAELEARFAQAPGARAAGTDVAGHRRRPLLAMAGLGAVAAAVAVLLLQSSGPGAEPAAAAAALHRAARVAEASDAPAPAPPGPGRLLYTKTKVVELQGWAPEGYGGGHETKPRYFTAHVPGLIPDAALALVPTAKEVWTRADGSTRVRETLGRIEFFSDADRQRWEAAGSPPPFAYDPGEHHVGHDRSGRPLKEFASRSWRGAKEFSFASRLPTEPKALRRELEGRPAGSAPVTAPAADSRTGSLLAERLMNVLSEPLTSPALRAAAFNALAELPGIELERGVTDATGRRGEAIVWVVEHGLGRRFVFDPRTAEILSRAEVILDADAAGIPGVPDGTPLREIAFLASGLVDSPRETVDGSAQ